MRRFWTDSLDLKFIIEMRFGGNELTDPSEVIPISFQIFFLHLHLSVNFHN